MKDSETQTSVKTNSKIITKLSVIKLEIVTFVILI
jgi:hypothetical protein